MCRFRNTIPRFSFWSLVFEGGVDRNRALSLMVRGTDAALEMQLAFSGFLSQGAIRLIWSYLLGVTRVCRVGCV